MCGRYSLGTPADALHDLFGLADAPAQLEPRYNIAPTQGAPVVRLEDGERHLALLHWGLVPRWAKDLSTRARHINARSETVADRRTYAESYRSRRCLVAADGFYEWRVRGRERLPVRFHLPNDAPFAFAGLWARWRRADDPYESFTILTTEANEQVSPTHDRMPVILRPEAFAPWLDPGVDDPEALGDIQRLQLNEELASYRVSTFVNNVRNDSARCIEPASAQGAEQASLF